MAGIIERIQSAVGSDYAKIAEFAHQHFQERMTHHGHFGRAAVETVAEVCRRHPAVIGLASGLLIDRLLVAEAHHHDAKVKAEAEVAAAPVASTVPPEEMDAKAMKKAAKAARAKAKHEPIRLTNMKPGRIAFEVFGGVLLLKMAASGAKIFRHRHQDEIWFAPAAKIHLFSATLCAYNLSKALRSKNVSAWRNGAILFFGTDAIKPVLKWYRTHPRFAAQPAAVAQPELVAAPVQPAAAAQPAPTAAQMARAFSHEAPGSPYVATDPALAAAQAFAGMMKPHDYTAAAPGHASAPNLQIVN